jgi:ribosomal protein S18 acetylase RimI-like enzyme
VGVRMSERASVLPPWNVRRFEAGDRAAAADALAASGAFRAEEIGVALGVIDDALADDEGYLLLAGDHEGAMRGYVCAGSTPLTASTWHLYWICVHPEAAGRGLARAMQDRLELLVRSRGGARLVVETSGRTDYERARHFYEAAGYERVGRILDFYGDGDDCVLYCKKLIS